MRRRWKIVAVPRWGIDGAGAMARACNEAMAGDTYWTRRGAVSFAKVLRNDSLFSPFMGFEVVKVVKLP